MSEIAEHVSLVESQILRLLTMLLAKAEGDGVGADASGRIGPIGVEPMIERSKVEKYTAPDAAVPKGEQPITNSIESIKRTRAALIELKPRMEKVDMSKVSYPHPAFGPMTPYQWLVLIGLHEQRHLDQIEAVLSSSVVNNQ